MVIRIDGDKLFSCAIQNTKRRRVPLFELSHEHTPTNVSIGVRWKTCIEVLHKEGRYGSASEIMREGLRQPDSNAHLPGRVIPAPQFTPAPDRRPSQALERSADCLNRLCERSAAIQWHQGWIASLRSQRREEPHNRHHALVQRCRGTAALKSSVRGFRPGVF